MHWAHWAQNGPESGSASGGGDEVEGLAGGKNWDVAERAEREQIAVAGHDEGARAPRAQART